MLSTTTKRHNAGFSLVVFLLCAIFISIISPASSYKPPFLPNGSTKEAERPSFDKNIHVVATQWAIDLLEADGQSIEAHGTLKKHFEALVEGLREAETSGGVFSLKRKPKNERGEEEKEVLFHRNTFGHFVDVIGDSKQGLEFLDSINQEDLAEVLPTASKAHDESASASSTDDDSELTKKWKLDAARGPNIALTDLVDWHYALAVEHMKKGEVREAMLNLGYVAHFVQDSTVPQRVSRDGWLRQESHLVEYERECEELLLNSQINKPANGGIYKTAELWKPHHYVHFGATSSEPFVNDFLDNASLNKTNALLAANELVPLAAKLTAGVFIRFFYGWYSERFTLITLSIDRVQTESEEPSLSGALFPTAVLGGDEGVANSKEQRRAAITVEISDFNPNEGFATYSWVWTKWIDERDYKEAVARANKKESLSEQEEDNDIIDEPWVPITISLWNQKVSAQQVDISPDVSDDTLRLRYGLKSGQIWLCYHLYPNPSVHPTLSKLHSSQETKLSLFETLAKKAIQAYDFVSVSVGGNAKPEGGLSSAKLQISVARFPKIQTGLPIGKKLGLITAAVTSVSMAILAMVVIIYRRRKETQQKENIWRTLESSSSATLTEPSSPWPDNFLEVLNEQDLLIEDLHQSDDSQYHHQYYIV